MHRAVHYLPSCSREPPPRRYQRIEQNVPRPTPSIEPHSSFEVFQEDELDVDVDVEVEVVTEQIEDRIPESAHEGMTIETEIRQPSTSFQLPGCAEEVESYPCIFCDDKIFLTGNRLKDHAQKYHPENLEDAIRQIVLIEEEWKKRRQDDMLLKRQKARKSLPKASKLKNPNMNRQTGMERVNGNWKKYICHYCGTFCYTMTDLNLHKSNYHILESIQEKTRKEIRNFHKKQTTPVIDSLSSSSSKSQSDAMRNSWNGSSIDNPCSTSCKICGLRMVRPSLLIRHMKRVHDMCNFTCQVTTPFLPSFTLSVVNSTVTWTCCAVKYTKRLEFLDHRRKMHLESVRGVNNDLELEDEEELQQAEENQMNTQNENPSQFNLDQIHSQTQLQDFTAEQEQGVELQAEIIDGPEGAMLVLPEGTELNAGGQYVIVIDGEEMQVNIGDSEDTSEGMQLQGIGD
ncbi:hypothetical protein WR25_04282 [Diploscapter pachys]|uniref:C2H2-type domain-containing protein n=1 Tax=Diploscapter pachys TaxID=2018661 RepID=A0A2A2KVG0_9BILA|nr:hypothetical protein WR25_04282 [Diploscapter pachys]